MRTIRAWGVSWGVRTRPRHATDPPHDAGQLWPFASVGGLGVPGLFFYRVAGHILLSVVKSGPGTLAVRLRHPREGPRASSRPVCRPNVHCFTGRGIP